WRREAVMGTVEKPPGKAMYVASRPDRDWLWIVQRRPYTGSEQHGVPVFRELSGCLGDSRSLRMALVRFAGDRGRRTTDADDTTGGAGGSVPADVPGLAPAASRSIMESPVHNERCTPGSEGGARKPTGESRQGAGRPPYATSTSWPQPSQWQRTNPRARSP